MAHRMGYWVDLSAISLDEQDGTTWIQAMPLGTYEHPLYGTIDITPERVSRFADNVKNRVRDQDLDVDYDHKAKSGEAAGWVNDARVGSSGGLDILVKWTSEAYDKIKSKAYRYFSPEFVDEWQHPKSGETIKDVLFGGALTNMPFLKDIQPINMSELFAEQSTGGGMDPKKLRKQLGLPEDATDEQVSAALDERLKVPEGRPEGEPEGEPEGKPESKNEPEGGKPESTKEPQLALLSEGAPTAEVIKSLSESKDPAVRALAAIALTQNQQLESQGATIKLAESGAAVRKLTEGQKVGFSANQSKKLTELLFKAPKALSDEVIAFVEDVVKNGLVKLGEVPGSNPESQGADAFARLDKEIAKVMSENEGMSYADAAIEVSVKSPDLYEAHRQEING